MDHAVYRDCPDKGTAPDTGPHSDSFPVVTTHRGLLNTVTQTSVDEYVDRPVAVELERSFAS